LFSFNAHTITKLLDHLFKVLKLCAHNFFLIFALVLTVVVAFVIFVVRLVLVLHDGVDFANFLVQRVNLARDRVVGLLGALFDIGSELCYLSLNNGARGL
jgi:hypothetical protein